MKTAVAAVAICAIAVWYAVHLASSPMDVEGAVLHGRIASILDGGSLVLAEAGRPGFLNDLLSCSLAFLARFSGAPLPPELVPAFVSLASMILSFIVLALLLEARSVPALLLLAITAPVLAISLGTGNAAPAILCWLLGVWSCRRDWKGIEPTIFSHLSGLWVFLLWLEGVRIVLLLPLWLVAMLLRWKMHGARALVPSVLVFLAPTAVLAVAFPDRMGELPAVGRPSFEVCWDSLPAAWLVFVGLGAIGVFRKPFARIGLLFLSGPLLLPFFAATSSPRDSAFFLVGLAPWLASGIDRCNRIDRLRRAPLGWIAAAGILIMSYPAARALAWVLHARDHVYESEARWLSSERENGDVFFVTRPGEREFFAAYGWPARGMVSIEASKDTDQLLGALETAWKGGGRALIVLGPDSESLRSRLASCCDLENLRSVAPTEVRQQHDPAGRSLDPGLLSLASPEGIYKVEPR